eukprot:349738-Chlamydomonas_euryale.AAC.10
MDRPQGALRPCRAEGHAGQRAVRRPCRAHGRPQAMQGRGSCRAEGRTEAMQCRGPPSNHAGQRVPSARWDVSCCLARGTGRSKALELNRRPIPSYVQASPCQGQLKCGYSSIKVWTHQQIVYMQG